jgi:hypothetical protein
MKRIYVKYLLLAMAFVMASCSDMLDTESDNIAYEEEHQLNNPNDSIYSVMGVLAKMQNLADRIVIYGELRGDLMVHDKANASTDIQAIGQFTSTESNVYAGKRDFYDVINNCNYIIAHMDTTITEGQTKVMVSEFAQVKTLRAWTYLQMALIFGQVTYYTQPLTSMADSVNIGTKMGLEDLIPALIEDIEPYADVRPLNYGSVDSWNSAEFFVPTRMLLGDLYLCVNNYAKAAENYYTYIYNMGLTVSSGYANTWDSPQRDAVFPYHFNAYRNEVITRIVFDGQLKSKHSQLLKLTYSETPSLLPAPSFVTEMNSRTHFHTDNNAGISRYFDGDLRGMGTFGRGGTFADAFGPVSVSKNSARQTLITKFFNNLNGAVTEQLQNRPLTSLAVYRPSLAYLRYAEAINRMGKPTMAFAVLKYGLNHDVVNDTLKVDSNEVKSLPFYMNFNDERFNYNVGTASRGCGMGISFDTDRYIIPAEVDTTTYVEDAILQEMAAETCFEGNRFFDLFCIARHRGDFPGFMAEKVASKFDDPKAMLSKLLNADNWFVKP